MSYCRCVAPRSVLDPHDVGCPLVTSGLSIGENVTMTALGRTLASERHVLPAPGIVVDIYRDGRQVYVRRDPGGCEWWPIRAWRHAAELGA